MLERGTILILMVLLILLTCFVLQWLEHHRLSSKNYLNKIYPKSSSLPSWYERVNLQDRVLATKRKILSTTKLLGNNSITYRLNRLPLSYSIESSYPGKSTIVMDQLLCSECLVFSIASALSDRYHIAGTLDDSDYLSPYNFAACSSDAMCNRESSNIVSSSTKYKKHKCSNICMGKTMRQGMKDMLDIGLIRQSDVNRITDDDEFKEYLCITDNLVKLYKPRSVKKASILTDEEIVYGATEERLLLNEISIMEELVDKGTLVAMMQIPTEVGIDFHNYKTGIYGSKSERAQLNDEYHAINITGYGVDIVRGEPIKYWLVKNSWSKSWGMQGYCRILRGTNCLDIESDVQSIIL